MESIVYVLMATGTSEIVADASEHRTRLVGYARDSTKLTAIMRDYFADTRWLLEAQHGAVLSVRVLTGTLPILDVRAANGGSVIRYHWEAVSEFPINARWPKQPGW